MEGHCSTGQSPQWAVVSMEEEEEVTYRRKDSLDISFISSLSTVIVTFLLKCNCCLHGAPQSQ